MGGFDLPVWFMFISIIIIGRNQESHTVQLHHNGVLSYIQALAENDRTRAFSFGTRVQSRSDLQYHYMGYELTGLYG